MKARYLMGGTCLYFVISPLPAERCLRSCSLCRAFSPKQKRSTAARWQGRSFESRPTGPVRRGWKSIPVHKPPPFLLRSRTLCKHRRKSRKPGLVHRPRHPQRQSRSSARRRLQSSPTAREWLPTHRDPSRSVQPGGRSRYSAFNSARRGASKPYRRWLFLAGSEKGKGHANGRALSRRGDERDSAPKLLRHEIVDDVEAETDTALGTSGGEERIKHVTLDFFRNAAAVIRESDLDLFRAEATRLDQHVSARPVGEGVSDGVEDQVGQHLPVGAGEAVHDDVGGHLNRK